MSLTRAQYEALSPAEKQQVMANATPAEMALLLAPVYRASAISIDETPAPGWSNVPRARPSSLPPSSQERIFQILAAVFAGIAAFAIFLPMVHIPIMGQISLFTARGFVSAAVIVLAVAIILSALLRFYFPAIVSALLLGGLAGYTLFDLTQSFNEMADQLSAHGSQDFGLIAGQLMAQASGIDLGLPVMIFSAILALLFSVLGAVKKR